MKLWVNTRTHETHKKMTKKVSICPWCTNDKFVLEKQEQTSIGEPEQKIEILKCSQCDVTAFIRNTVH